MLCRAAKNDPTGYWPKGRSLPRRTRRGETGAPGSDLTAARSGTTTLAAPAANNVIM